MFDTAFGQCLWASTPDVLLPPCRASRNLRRNNYILPSGHMFVYCDASGIIVNPYTGAVLTNVPPHLQVG